MAGVKKLKEQTKNYAIADGAAWSVMSAFGYQYITPYALVLGASSFLIGIISAFSTLAAGIGQYVGAWWLQFEKSRKTQIVNHSAIQAILWLPIAFAFIFSENAVVFLLVVYSLLIFFGNMVSPAWTSLIGDIVEKNERGRYFGMRNKICGFVELVSGVAAGILLKWYTNNIYLGFAAIFIIAFLFRMISNYYLKKHYDPPFKPKKRKFFESVKFPNDINFKYFLLLSAGMIFGTNIAGPFFAVYMLRDLKFDYVIFAIVNAASAIATIITLPYWGKVIDKYGTRAVLFACSILIPFYPLLWLVSINTIWIILIHLFSGFAWAGFNLAVFNFIFKIAPREKLPTYAAHANGLSSVASFAGSIAGSFLVLFVNNTSFFFMNGLEIIFLISAVVRFAVAALALPNIKLRPGIKGSWFLQRVVTVYPVKGLRAELSSFHENVSAFLHK